MFKYSNEKARTASDISTLKADINNYFGQLWLCLCVCVCGMRWPLDALSALLTLSLLARQHFPANSRAMCADSEGKQSWAKSKWSV